MATLLEFLASIALEDPIVGNGQKSTSICEQVINNFNPNKNEGIRIAKSLETKWGCNQSMM